MELQSTDINKIVKSYIELGLNIIPVKNDKRPAVDSWKIYQDKKIDLEEFNLLVKSKSAFGLVRGVGVITGKISGITIIDFDAGSNDFFNGIETPTVRTGGGGKHYYFKYSDKVETSTNANLKIDIRNNGGYAIMPPSVLEKGSYSWIKDLKTPLLELPEHFIKDYQKETKKISFDFKGVSEGSRNETGVRVAGKLVQTHRDDLDLAFASLEAWNKRNNPPLSEEEIKAIFQWVVKTDKQNYPELYNLKAKEVTAVKNLSEFSIDELFSYEERESLTTGILDIDAKFKHPAGYYSVLASPGVGKGWWALFLIKQFYKRHSKKSVYFSLEMTSDLIKRRILQAWSDLSEEEFIRFYNVDNSKFQKAIDIIKGGAILIDEFGGSDTTIQKPEVFKEKVYDYYGKGYRVFMFDHLHQLGGATVNDTNQKVTEVWGNCFQGIVKDLRDIWLFIFVQPVKSSMKETILQLEHIMGSGSFGQKVEFFYSLNRKIKIDKETGLLNIDADNREIIFYLGKNRITSNSNFGTKLELDKTGNFVRKYL